MPNENKIMKAKITTLILLLSGVQFGFPQGFANLDFEAANVSGYAVGGTIPTANAFPDWTAFFFSDTITNTLDPVNYDAISLGSAEVSVVDSRSPAGFGPIQGNYSAYLFGSMGYSMGIRQTGLVPVGTKSLFVDVYAWYGFNVALNGQTISMTPLQTFSNYTLYGGDISSFAGQVSTLSIIAPPLAGPNGVEIDSIILSPSSIPEPSIFVLFVLGGLLFVLRHWPTRKA